MTNKSKVKDRIEITLPPDNKVEVRKAKTWMASTKGRKAYEVIDILPDLQRQFPDCPENDLYAQAVMIYPALYACTFPQESLPSVSEFLDMPDAAASIWVEAVHGINPHWLTFETPKEEMSLEDKKKKEEKP